MYKQTTWTYTLNKFESWNVFKTSCHGNAKIYITVIVIEAIYYFGEESPEIFKESGTCKRPAVAQLVIGYKNYALNWNKLFYIKYICNDTIFYATETFFYVHVYDIL